MGQCCSTRREKRAPPKVFAWKSPQTPKKFTFSAKTAKKSFDAGKEKSISPDVRGWTDVRGRRAPIEGELKETGSTSITSTTTFIDEAPKDSNEIPAGDTGAQIDSRDMKVMHEDDSDREGEEEEQEDYVECANEPPAGSLKQLVQPQAERAKQELPEDDGDSRDDPKEELPWHHMETEEEEVVMGILKKGEVMTKYPRGGGIVQPTKKEKMVQIDMKNGYMIYRDIMLAWDGDRRVKRGKGGLTKIALTSVTQLFLGKHTPPFKKSAAAAAKGNLCFSLEDEERTYDFEVADAEMFDRWLKGIIVTIDMHTHKSVKVTDVRNAEKVVEFSIT
mmetsp:Transcript_38486/g.61748  ORF Transcript_38486/g.61748 Transcript_38486/m.61748 type:complete len:333 (-) Transcript_38486:227-1225(-)|eukprot:jgi/Bigna1/76484/fgenesh1_pg.41_\